MPVGKITLYRKGKHGYGRKRKVATVATVKRMLNRNIETKRITSLTASSPVSSTGAVVDIFNPANGDEVHNRQGNKVMLKSISMSGLVRAPTAAVEPQEVRIMIVQHKGEGQLLHQDILNIPGAMPQAQAFYAFQNTDSLPNVKILYDRRIPLGFVNGTPNMMYPFRFKKVFKNGLPVSWTAADAHEKNGIFMYTMGSLGTGVASLGSFDYQIAATYQDA